MIQKLFLIMFLWSCICVIVGLMVEHGLGVTLIKGWTGAAIEDLIVSFNLSDQIEENPLLIFGNFYSAAKAIVTLAWQSLSGGIVTDVIQNLPFLNDYLVLLLVRFIYGFSVALFIIQMVSGRLPG